MANVFAKVVVAPADINLLAGDCVGAIAIWLCLGPQRADVGTRLWLRQVHCAAPLTRNEFGNIHRLDLVRCVMLQRFDLALGHQRVELQGQARARHHLVNACGQCHWQAHTAKFRISSNTDPATFGHSGITVSKTGGGTDNAVLQLGRMQIAIALQWGQNLFTQLGSFGQDSIYHVARCFAELLGLSDLCKIHNMIHQKADVVDRRAIWHVGLQ